MSRGRNRILAAAALMLVGAGLLGKPSGAEASGFAPSCMVDLITLKWEPDFNSESENDPDKPLWQLSLETKRTELEKHRECLQTTAMSEQTVMAHALDDNKADLESLVRLETFGKEIREYVEFNPVKIMFEATSDLTPGNKKNMAKQKDDSMSFRFLESLTNLQSLPTKWSSYVDPMKEWCMKQRFRNLSELKKQYDEQINVSQGTADEDGTKLTLLNNGSELVTGALSNMDERFVQHMSAKINSDEQTPDTDNKEGQKCRSLAIGIIFYILVCSGIGGLLCHFLCTDKDASEAA